MNEELHAIAERILSADSAKNEIAATQKLEAFYYALLTSLEINADSKQFTDINGGVALSPKHAIDCIKDGVRTSRFLKGIFKALHVALSTEREGPLEILYAGCGPLATLLVPLLPHFKSNQLQITLLDIHEVSIVSSKKIIEHLELEDFFFDYKTCDATKYEHPKKIDVLITETMDKGLTKEPQVTISEHLCQQLSDDGILVPKQISLYTGTAPFSELPKCDISLLEENAISAIQYEQPLFSIHRKSEISSKGFESNIIKLPKDIELTPDICVFTEIEIFDNVYMTVGDALITNPICVGTSNTVQGTHYTLIYNTNPSPSWSIKQKNGTE